MFFGGKKKAGKAAFLEDEEVPLVQDDDDEGFINPQVDGMDDPLMEILLPWGVEQRVAMWLNMIKIPLICIVCILGCVVESKIGIATEEVWTKSSYLDKGPSCYISRMDMDKWFAGSNNTYLKAVSEAINASAGWIKEYINESLHDSNSTACEMVDGEWRCEIIDTSKYGLNLTYPKSMCGIIQKQVEDPEAPAVCEAPTNPNSERPVVLTDKTAGYADRFFFLPYTLVWAIYKLTFLPVHPIDRVVRFFEEKKPPSQPIFKLLTEPHWNAGGCTKPLALFTMVVKIIRYTLLPNSLIIPLVTMGAHPHCTNFFYYTYDAFLGRWIYYFVIWEFASVAVLYVLGKTVLHSTCIYETPNGKHKGRKLYRCYKCIWYMTSGTSLVLFIIDQVMIFNWRFWEGLNVMIRQVIWLSFDFRFSIDVVQLAASINVLLDVVSMFVMIGSFLCPKLCTVMTGGDPSQLTRKLPGPAGKLAAVAASAASGKPLASVAKAPAASSVGAGKDAKKLGLSSAMSSVAGKLPNPFGKKK